MQRVEIALERERAELCGHVARTANLDFLYFALREARIERLELRKGFIRPIALRNAFRKANTRAGKHGMGGDFLCGVEVFSQKRWRHHERGGCVGESFTRGSVDWKFPRGIELFYPGKITNRVGVLHVRKSPEHHRSRITGVCERNFIKR